MNRKAERLLLALECAPPGRVVEIGCIREEAESLSEGYSTFYLCRRCLELNLDFRSFAIHPTEPGFSSLVFTLADGKKPG